jgi:hypothetical protein
VSVSEPSGELTDTWPASSGCEQRPRPWRVVEEAGLPFFFVSFFLGKQKERKTPKNRQIPDAAYEKHKFLKKFMLI